eukprot:320467-Chlamydomonas_euryale.AAC.2
MSGVLHDSERVLLAAVRVLPHRSGLVLLSDDAGLSAPMQQHAFPLRTPGHADGGGGGGGSGSGAARPVVQLLPGQSYTVTLALDLGSDAVRSGHEQGILSSFVFFAAMFTPVRA